jgi:hypothetical protein
MAAFPRQSGQEKTATVISDFALFPKDADVTSPEARVATVEVGVVTVEARVATVEVGVATVEADVATVEAGVATVEAGVATVEAGVATVEAGVATVEAGVAKWVWRQPLFQSTCRPWIAIQRTQAGAR